MVGGADEETTVACLVERGVEPARARHAVETVYPQVMQAAEAETLEPRALVPAALAGIVAAVAGGAAFWFAFAIYAAWRIPRPLGIEVRRGPISGI